jgi:ADP-heptose:LPS heptosyltransferase
LGDAVVALPFFNRIAELYANCERIVLTNVPVSSKAAPALAVLGSRHLVHGAISYPTGARSASEIFRLRATLRELGANILIYLMPERGLKNILRDYCFLKTCGFTRIIGLPTFRGLDRPRIDPATGETEPEVERLARMLAALGPFQLSVRENWNLWLDEAELEQGDAAVASLPRGNLFALNMGGKVAKNDWGRDNWRGLVSGLRQIVPGTGLLLVGGQEDRARSEDVAAHWSGPTVNACGRLTPRQSAAALRHAKLFIGHDSGPMHLASAMGVPCVALFGDNNPPRKWHPYLGNNSVLHDMRGVTAISVTQAQSAVERLLRDLTLAPLGTSSQRFS